MLSLFLCINVRKSVLLRMQQITIKSPFVNITFRFADMFVKYLTITNKTAILFV